MTVGQLPRLAAHPVGIMLERRLGPLVVSLFSVLSPGMTGRNIGRSKAREP